MDVVASWISAEGFFYSEFNNKVWKAINKLYKDKVGSRMDLEITDDRPEKR